VDVVLAGLLLEALIVLLLVLIMWLPSVSPPKISTRWITRPIANAFEQALSWAYDIWTAPGGHVRVGIWELAFMVVVAVFVIPGLEAYRPEAVSVAFTVLVLNELIRYQSRLEFKQSTIRQMASLSNDFALDAARIAKEEAWLRDGSLEGVDLTGANLEGAYLTRAILVRTDLEHSNLKGANLSDALLIEACLRNAHLEKSDMRDAHLEMADLLAAHMEEVLLWRAKLWRAILADAHLEGAELIWADLKEADLAGAHLDGAELWYVDLGAACLKYVRLEGANLYGANLERSELSYASFDHFSCYNNETKWPDPDDIPPEATNLDELDSTDLELFWKEWWDNRDRILREARITP
jgi:uncharacterized protein YjbI with pentapeptide repeats